MNKMKYDPNMRPSLFTVCANQRDMCLCVYAPLKMDSTNHCTIVFLRLPLLLEKFRSIVYSDLACRRRSPFNFHLCAVIRIFLR